MVPRFIPGGNDARPVDGTYRNITTGSVVGNHRTHMTSAVTTTSQAITACTPCHAPVTNAIDHRDGKINMRMHINSSAVNVRGYYNKPAGSPAAFFNQTSAPVLSTCNNVNCHFRTTTGNWGSAPLVGGQTEANCTYCHDSSGATPMTTGNHTRHIVKLGNTITTCATCHVDRTTFSHATTAKAGGTIAVVVSGGTYTAGTHATYPNYFGTTGYGSCNNIYCHSSAQSATGGAPPVYARATWGTSPDLRRLPRQYHGNTAVRNPYQASRQHLYNGMLGLPRHRLHRHHRRRSQPRQQPDQHQPDKQGQCTVPTYTQVRLRPGECFRHLQQHGLPR